MHFEFLRRMLEVALSWENGGLRGKRGYEGLEGENQCKIDCGNVRWPFSISRDIERTTPYELEGRGVGVRKDILGGKIFAARFAGTLEVSAAISTRGVMPFGEKKKEGPSKLGKIKEERIGVVNLHSLRAFVMGQSLLIKENSSGEKN